MTTTSENITYPTIQVTPASTKPFAQTVYEKIDQAMYIKNYPFDCTFKSDCENGYFNLAEYFLSKIDKTLSVGNEEPISKSDLKTYDIFKSLNNKKLNREGILYSYTKNEQTILNVYNTIATIEKLDKFGQFDKFIKHCTDNNFEAAQSILDVIDKCSKQYNRRETSLATKYSLIGSGIGIGIGLFFGLLLCGKINRVCRAAYHVAPRI